jgi:sensor histidine kinase regulating citrate/malate metabolism
LFFTIIYIIANLLKHQKKTEQQFDNSIFFLMVIPITTIFIMLTFVSISDHYALTPLFNWMISLAAVLLLVSNLVVFGINQYNQNKSREYTEMQLLLQRESNFIEYYKMILSQNENQSILIHDIKKHLQSIELLNEQNDREKIRAYIRQLLLSSDLKEVSRICDHEFLNAILCRYQKQCEDKHISFIADIRSGTNNFLSDNELTSLYCNLLENAIEAINNIENPYIEINSTKKDNTPFVIITVINSCLVNPFSAEDKSSLISHKTDKQKHGFGIKSIQKIVKKYHGDMQMYYNSDSLTFHTIITLKEI